MIPKIDRLQEIARVLADVSTLLNQSNALSFSFNGNYNSGYVENQRLELKEAYEKTIEILREENAYVRKMLETILFSK